MTPDSPQISTTAALCNDSLWFPGPCTRGRRPTDCCNGNRQRRRRRRWPSAGPRWTLTVSTATRSRAAWTGSTRWNAGPRWTRTASRATRSPVSAGSRRWRGTPRTAATPIIRVSLRYNYYYYYYCNIRRVVTIIIVIIFIISIVVIITVVVITIRVGQKIELENNHVESSVHNMNRKNDFQNQNLYSKIWITYPLLPTTTII